MIASHLYHRYHDSKKKSDKQLESESQILESAALPTHQSLKKHTHSNQIEFRKNPNRSNMDQNTLNAQQSTLVLYNIYDTRI